MPRFLLSFLTAWETELSQPKCCQIEVVGECGREEARKKICEMEAGPSPLVVLRNVVPNSTSFRSVTIQSNNEDGILSSLDLTHLLLQFFSHDKVSVSTRSCKLKILPDCSGSSHIFFSVSSRVARISQWFCGVLRVSR